MVLGGAFWNLGPLATGLAPGKRGHRRGLATEGLQNLLGQSFAAKEWRSPASEFRAQSVNQADGGREPVLGRASHSWGITQIGTGDFRAHGFAAHAEVQEPPSQTWRAFLNNHVQDLVSVDFFTVPTVSFRVLFVFVVLAHHRRRIVHFNVTEHPTAGWTGQQMVEAFPEDTAPRYLLRDRDKIYRYEFHHRIQSMPMEEVLSAPASPWQRAYVERLIGSIRRDCLDHVIVLGEGHLRKILRSYLEYYQRSRTHLALSKDAPEPRTVQSPEMGEIVELSQVGGLHHRYERRAA
jgi:putative transposase